MNYSQLELLNIHAQALYTTDSCGSLRTINEPWDQTAPACRFFLGRTLDGQTLARFRCDIPAEIREQIVKLSADEGAPIIGEPPRHAAEYISLLGGGRVDNSICFRVPKLEIAKECESITRANVHSLTPDQFKWLKEDIDVVQPCFGAVIDGMAVSICRSVRITGQAHEAGIETLPGFRGRGLAPRVLTAWAAAARELGVMPLYSTFAENTSSRSVAKKSGLVCYGVGFTVR